MFDKLISAIAPHPCCSCGALGALLCDDCKYDIVSETYSACISCGGPAKALGVCKNCAMPYSKAWCAGERTGALEHLVNKYKFQNAYAAHKILAELIVECLDVLPPETYVVPVPTVAAHVRERGYDHTLLIARSIARARGLRLSKALRRRTTTKQRGAARSQRRLQAKEAFVVAQSLKPVPYLLIDDVTTTGATLYYAADQLKKAGASDVWVAVVARQPLD
jgi:ComF family protein